MRITNKHNLPEPVYNFIARDRYQAGENDISVTTLLKPPQVFRLEKEHFSELEVDALDMVWSLVGSGVHALLDAHTESGAINEQRFYADFSGITLGGQVDHFNDGVITDYKVTSAFSVAYGNTKPEWEQQLNCYAYLLHIAGHTVTGLRICAILRDWDKHRAKREEGYPDKPIQIISIPMWTTEACEEFIQLRLQDAYAEVVRPCLPEEMWQSETKYAVVRNGNKRASKVCETEEEAIDYIGTNTGFRIDLREGERKRCAEYCSVSNYCKQYQDYLNETSVS